MFGSLTNHISTNSCLLQLQGAKRGSLGFKEVACESLSNHQEQNALGSGLVKLLVLLVNCLIFGVSPQSLAVISLAVISLLAWSTAMEGCSSTEAAMLDRDSSNEAVHLVKSRTIHTAVGQKYRVPKLRFGKRKNRPKPVVPKGFLFHPYSHTSNHACSYVVATRLQSLRRVQKALFAEGFLRM